MDDSLAERCQPAEAALASQVRDRLGMRGLLSIDGMLTPSGNMLYCVRWRRAYGDSVSDERYARAESVAEGLAKVLAWEDDADADDAARAGVRMAYAPQAGNGVEGE